MSWVVVDKQGVEFIFRQQPFRWAEAKIELSDLVLREDVPFDITENIFNPFGRTQIVAGEIGVHEVYDKGDDYVIGFYELTEKNIVGWGSCDNSRIKIPKGSIKKLIGRDLTWEDEPVELK